MKIYPAIDLQGGQVVQLVGGDPENVGNRSDKSAGEQANYWRSEGATRIQVVDLDAALGGTKQWRDLGQVIASGVAVQFGGGIRSMIDVQHLLDLGVERVIVGTQGVENPLWVRELSTIFPGRIVLALDAKGTNVVTQGWTETSDIDAIKLATELADANLAGILYTNVDHAGKLAGIDPDVTKALRAAAGSTELIVRGGISSMQDLAVLDGLGVDAVVLGMSIYTEAISVHDAIERFEKLEST